jgi:HEAT repeat protein
MLRTRLVGVLLAALAAVAVSCGALAAPAAPGDLFAQLKQYDFQNRTAVVAIRQMIGRSHGNPALRTQIEDGLLGVLKDPSATMAGKQEASRLLALAGTARSVPALAKMLNSDATADLARYALERNMDPSAGAALRAAMAKAKGKTLVGIINSVGDRADPDAVPQLKRLAASKDRLVSEAAITALGKVGTPAAMAALAPLAKSSAAASSAMVRCAARMAASGHRPEAEKALVSLAGPGRPALARAAALQALAAMKSPKADAVALSDLKTAEPYVQVVAARVAGSLTSPATTRSAMALWPKLAPPIQVVLLTAWADRREPAVASLALKATQSANPDVRRAAITAAARTAGAAAVPRLAEIAAAGEGEDRGVARECLSSMPGKTVDQAILQAASKSRPQVRSALMGVLADRPSASARAALMQAINGSNTSVAVEALQAIGRVGGAQEYPALIKTLTNASDATRDAAQNAVMAVARRLGDPTAATGPILAAMPSASPAARAALIGVLADIGGDAALAAVVNAADSPEATVKAAAVQALAETWQDPRPEPTLLEVARRGDTLALRVEALKGYLRLLALDDTISAETKVNRVAEALSIAERPEEKWQALSVLRECRVPAAVELAAKCMDDPALAPEAASTIIYLAAPQRSGNEDLPAVRGDVTNAALDKVIQLSKDDNQRQQAEKLKQ